MLKIRAEKDFWAGVLYAALALAFLWFGRDYRMGTAARMGPGYFPFYLSIALLVLGVASIVRSFLNDGEPVGGIAWKPAFWIVAAVVAFGLLLKPAGLVIALIAMCALSFYASMHFRVDGLILLGLAALIVFCILVFVKGLGVAIPIFGTWFEPFLPQWLIR